MTRRANHLPKLGIKTSAELDLAGMMAHKTKVVGELTKGVEFLLKKNKSEAIVGEGADRGARQGRGEAQPTARRARSTPNTSSSPRARRWRRCPA